MIFIECPAWSQSYPGFLGPVPSQAFMDKICFHLNTGKCNPPPRYLDPVLNCIKVGFDMQYTLSVCRSKHAVCPSNLAPYYIVSYYFEMGLGLLGHTIDDDKSSATLPFPQP